MHCDAGRLYISGSQPFETQVPLKDFVSWSRTTYEIGPQAYCGTLNCNLCSRTTRQMGADHWQSANHRVRTAVIYNTILHKFQTLTDDKDSVLIVLVCYSDECGLSDDMKEMLIEAQEQDRLTCGIYESGKLLEM